MKKPPIPCVCFLILLVSGVIPSHAHTHDKDSPISAQVVEWLKSLGKHTGGVQFSFDSDLRYQFRWTPGERKGIRLDALDDGQRKGLKAILNTVLSEQGAVKIDAIIATEAALAVIQNSPEFRNPGKYYTLVFGQPGAGNWGLRFEGHHLSVNLTFKGDKLLSATPLFLGANPETVPQGPDKGLRALRREVDLARELFRSLSDTQRKLAGDSQEWFAGFLTDAGTRRANMGKPMGIRSVDLNANQQTILRGLIRAYVDTMDAHFATHYIGLVLQDWSNIRFFWKGGAEKGGDYYYRIRGTQLLIEQDTQSGDTHIHAIWRDALNDFGGQ